MTIVVAVAEVISALFPLRVTSLPARVGENREPEIVTSVSNGPKVGLMELITGNVDAGVGAVSLPLHADKTKPMNKMTAGCSMSFDPVRNI